jgi:hypothetical protein
MRDWPELGRGPPPIPPFLREIYFLPIEAYSMLSLISSSIGQYAASSDDANQRELLDKNAINKRESSRIKRWRK